MNVIARVAESPLFLWGWVMFWIVVIVSSSYVGKNLWRTHRRKSHGIRDIEIPLGAEATLPMSLCEQLRDAEEHFVFDEPCNFCSKKITLGEAGSFPVSGCVCVNKLCPIANSG